MAEFDDDRPDFDAVFADEPDDPPIRLRRFSRPGRRPGPEPRGDTGESARARAEDGEEPGVPGFGERPASRRGGRGGGRPRRGGGRRGRGGGVRAGGGAAVLQGPRGRLLLGVAFAAILILVISLVVRDCQRNRLEDSYTRYMNGVAQLVQESADQGKQLRQIMANPRGDRPPQLKQKIQTLAGEARGLVDRAQGLDPPGALSSPQSSFVTALEYRVTGLMSLADNLPTLLKSRDRPTKAAGLAKPMQRFLASDVIYRDSFEGPASRALEDDDISGIEVPPVQPFLPNPALASPDGAATLIAGLQRRGNGGGGNGGGDGQGNLRGTSLEATVALPSETRLTPGQVQSVQASEQLKWAVTVTNGGDFDETGVVVGASFSYPGSPNEVDTKETAIDSIASGATVTVEIPGPTAPVYGEQGTLKIEIEPVSQETNTDNNAAEYPVKITI